MDPTGPLKWSSKFSSLFQAVFAISTLYIIHFSPFNHVGTLLWSLWNSTKAQGALLDLYGPQKGPYNGSGEANSRGPTIEKGPPGQLSLIEVKVEAEAELKNFWVLKIFGQKYFG